MKKIILFTIIGLVLLGLILNIVFPKTEEQKNSQVLNDHGGVKVTSKKTTQGDTCLIEILVTSKNEDLNVLGFTIPVQDINEKNLTFSFVKIYLKKDIAQQELKRFPITCEKIRILGVRIQK